MDMRTGETYETLQAAIDAGVPVSDIAEVTETPNGPEVRFASGPFKGRVYQRVNGQLRRVGGGRGWIEKYDGAGRPALVRR